MTRYPWARWGDVNAFFGLILDNVAVMIVLVVLVTSTEPAAEHRFSREFVLTQMIPGTALGVVLGDLVYTWMAFRLARRTGRPDVTAMPLGLDTPSTFAIGALVLLPALNDGMTRYGLDHGQAMVFGWHVGAIVLLMVGVFKSVLAPLGGKIRRWMPRAGLLGSLAGIALALIAFMPLWTHIAAVPVVGFLSLTVILVALVARHRLPGRIPGALAAVLLGVFVYYLGDHLSPRVRVADRAAARRAMPPLAWRAPDLLPELLMEPALVATRCSAGPGRSAGDVAVRPGHDRRRHRLYRKRGGGRRRVRHAHHPLDRRAGLGGGRGLCGGVIQNTPYIGQPAYKAMGGRAAYTLATALFIGAAGIFGWFTHLFEWLPEAAAFPILVFVGLEIAAQSFRATPERHFPALALAILPALAYLVLIAVDMVLPGGPLGRPCGRRRAIAPLPGQRLHCDQPALGVGPGCDAGWKAGACGRLPGIAGVCSLFGVIHSPLRPAAIALPQHVLSQMSQEPAIRCQSPYHWAAAYALAAALLILLHLLLMATILDTLARKSGLPTDSGGASFGVRRLVAAFRPVYGTHANRKRRQVAALQKAEQPLLPAGVIFRKRHFPCPSGVLFSYL